MWLVPAEGEDAGAVGAPADPHTAAARTQRSMSVPPWHLLVQRVAPGLRGVLCSLGATVPVDLEASGGCPATAADSIALLAVGKLIKPH
jgi:hypothetical protein